MARTSWSRDDQRDRVHPGICWKWLQVNKINDTQFTITSTPNNSTQMRPGGVIVYASTLTQNYGYTEEKAEEGSDNDDYVTMTHGMGLTTNSTAS